VLYCFVLCKKEEKGTLTNFSNSEFIVTFSIIPTIKRKNKKILKIIAIIVLVIVVLLSLYFSLSIKLDQLMCAMTKNTGKH